MILFRRLCALSRLAPRNAALGAVGCFIFVLGHGLSAAVPADEPDPRWARQVARVMAEAPVQRDAAGAVVLAGSSSVSRWSDLAELFPELAIVNRGIGGLWLADLAEYLDGLVLRWQPDTVVVYGGENDLAAGRTVTSVVESFERIHAQVRAARPEAHLIFLALKPSPWRAALTERFREANERIAAVCARDGRTTFVDVFGPLLDEHGVPRPSLFGPDRLHLNEAGYAIWNRLLAAALRSPAPASSTGHTWVLQHAENFAGPLDQWVVEQRPGGTVETEEGRLVINDANGCTVWFRPRLHAPVRIRYTATASSRSRVSDLNCFWMASDPERPDDLFHPAHNRDGSFASYDGLRTYYVGYGGNDNSTTRFRRYDGTGARPLAPEHDLRKPEHLLKADHPYQIELVVEGNRVQYLRDGEVLFDLTDPAVLTAGWFGFRTVRSRLEITDFTVWSAPADAMKR